jgi:hypothetical protein
MELKKYLDELPVERREAIASACGTTWGHLRNVSYGDKTCGIPLAVALEKETGISRRDLRPSDWGDIWPELIDDEHPWPVKTEV